MVACLFRSTLRIQVAQSEQYNTPIAKHLVAMVRKCISNGTTQADGTASKPSRQRGRPSKANARNASADPAPRKKQRTAAVAPAAAAGSGDESRPRQYYLMKSEPDVFSIDDLASRKAQTEPWDGVRSHQARKVMQSMRRGDLAFFYHSNCKPPGIVGVMEIVREAYPDHSQWNPKSEYYDKTTSPEAPKWYMVDCKLLRKLDRHISLDELKSHREGDLSAMHLFKYGRLSVQAVQPNEWEFVLALENQAGE